MVTQVVRELETGELDLFARHALSKAQAREYLRQSHVCLAIRRQRDFSKERLLGDPVDDYLRSYAVAETCCGPLATIKLNF